MIVATLTALFVFMTLVECYYNTNKPMLRNELENTITQDRKRKNRNTDKNKIETFDYDQYQPQHVHDLMTTFEDAPQIHQMIVLLQMYALPIMMNPLLSAISYDQTRGLHILWVTSPFEHEVHKRSYRLKSERLEHRNW
jgi:hypothetical protein